MDFVTFTPIIPATPPAPVLDAPLSETFMKRGAAGSIVARLRGQVRMDPGYRTFHLVKSSGTDTHRLPRPLLAFSRATANHQYRVSPFARDKVAILVWREALMGDPEHELLANMVHAHHLPRTGEQQRRFDHIYREMDMPHADQSVINNSWALHEYTYTSHEPTFYQTAPAARDLAIRFEMAAAMTDEADVPLTRAPERSVLFMTSRVFHRAPHAREIAPANIGRTRLFAHLMYLPVHGMGQKPA